MRFSETKLHFSWYPFYEDSIGETAYNSYTDVFYIFPDSVCEQLLPVMRNRYITTEEAISYDNARELEQAFTGQYPELADTGVSYSIRLSTLQVNSTKAGNFVLQAAMLYGAVVLMVICLTVLSLQQLLDAGQYRYRFSVLRKLAKAACRKRAEYNLELARYDFAMPDTLEDAEIAAILDRADELASWAADVKEYALQQALSGRSYPGYKVVEGRSNRRYINEETVASVVTEAGYDPYAHKVLGLTEMQKLLGKKKFEELLAGLIEKPQGKPALVTEKDKRPAMNTAQNDFKEN